MPTPTEMRQMVDKMIADGEMPSLDTVLDAVHGVRQEYVPKIKQARKEAEQENKSKQ